MTYYILCELRGNISGYPYFVEAYAQYPELEKPIYRPPGYYPSGRLAPNFDDYHMLTGISELKIITKQCKQLEADFLSVADGVVSQQFFDLSPTSFDWAYPAIFLNSKNEEVKGKKYLVCQPRRFDFFDYIEDEGDGFIPPYEIRGLKSDVSLGNGEFYVHNLRNFGKILLCDEHFVEKWASIRGNFALFMPHQIIELFNQNRIRSNNNLLKLELLSFKYGGKNSKAFTMEN